ncbi:kelch-like protein 28 [Ceratitis capitata]|uniref:kelch-like protein 28 n=1 Tax=Ceratitis capitata TaxID=7213 RepID=UPI00032A023B|nr:kelch-like protein 28 [Ceratitis capitata]
MGSSIAPSTPAEGGSKFNEKLLNGLRQFYDEQKLIDVTFKVSNPTVLIPAHRLILSAASIYFENLFSSNQVGTPLIEISDIDSDTFERLITFCYTGKTMITHDNAAKMLKAANILQLDDAAVDCVNFIFENITELSLGRVYVLERETQCERLRQKIREYEIQHFMEVKGSAEFLNFDYEKLKEIVESEDLNVTSEKDVFFAIKIWYEHDTVGRERHLPDLIGCLRLSQFDTNFILTNIQPLAGCESLALKTIVWVSQPLARTMVTLKFTEPRESLRTNLEEMTCLAVEISSGHTTSCLLRYNKTEDKWIKYADLDTQGVYRFSVILNDDNLIFTGGQRNEETNEVRSWNLRTKTWKQLPAMTHSRMNHSAALLDGKMYAIGGFNGRTSLASVEVFSSTGGWREVRNMNTPRLNAAVVTLNGNIFIMGGWNEVQSINSVERYDPTTDNWTYCANMNGSCIFPGAAVHKGFIYVVGVKGAERYDPQRDVWTKISLPTNSENPGCISLNNQLWAIGGWGYQQTDRSYVYDDESDRWMEKARLPNPGAYSCFIVPEAFL